MARSGLRFLARDARAAAPPAGLVAAYWVTVPDAPSLRPSAGTTVEAWVRPSARGGGWHAIAVKERSAGLAYGLYARGGGGLPAGHVLAGGEWATRGRAALAPGVWSHLAVTFDGARLRLYVNGIATASRRVRGRIASSREELRIGGTAVWNEWFAGTLDEVRVYSRALTAGEVRADMGMALAALPSPAAASTPRVQSLRWERRRRGLPLARHAVTR